MISQQIALTTPANQLLSQKQVPTEAPHLPTPNTRIHDMPTIQKQLEYCLQRIEEMMQETKNNDHLQKYFQMAGTNSQEILEALNLLLNEFSLIKSRVHEKDINLVIVSQLLAFLQRILMASDMEKMKNIQRSIWIVEFESKIVCCMEFIMNSLTLPYDITTMDKEHYKDTWDRIHTQVLGDPSKIYKNMDLLKRMLSITTAACLDEEKSDFKVTKLMSFGLSYPRYMVSEEKGKLKSMVFYRKPTIERARTIWNLPQNGMTMQFAKLGMKSIETNLKIYIPLDENIDPKDITQDDGKSIQVRVLFNNQIIIKNQKRPKSYGLCSGFAHTQDEDIDTVILHMHGGGFIALSSRSMQVYTRKWARDLRIPVFSVDYRMPPDHRFPTAPMDCLNVYKFLITKIHNYLNIRPKRIILAGDSAGGNLALSTTGLIMKEKLPLPIGIYAAYPACDSRKRFSPGKLFAFTDPLLNPAMLLLCLREYLSQKPENQYNPIASPVLMTEEFVGGEKGDMRFPLKWPRTIIQVGAEDPLYDDSLKLMERMVSSKVDCECQVYSNLSHGFLSLQFMVGECSKTVEDSIKHLEKLLK